MTRRLTDWIGGALSGIALYKIGERIRGRRTPEVAPSEPDVRADELREKLAEVRAVDEPVPAEPGESPQSVEERRRRVHEQGRSAIDEMHSE